jgi:hypothetical protein
VVIPPEAATDGDRYVDNDDGTVTDKVSGLMWQKVSPDNKMTWEKALEYCENLIFANYTDWRLPTEKELRSLVDSTRYDPAINTMYFPDAFSSFYWSSTSVAAQTNCAWAVDFDQGNSIYTYDTFESTRKSGSYYVRAVRVGQFGALDGWALTLI